MYVKKGVVYDYKDGIYDNRINKETFIRWSGQLKNKSSDQFSRKKQYTHME